MSGDVEGARASFAEGLRLSPGYAQLYHASARLEGKLLNWGALNDLNKRARIAFPQLGGGGVTSGSVDGMPSTVQDDALFRLTNSPVQAELATQQWAAMQQSLPRL